MVQGPTYNPNENELKMAQLQAKVAQLETSKTQWINAYTEYSNAIIDRDNVLYGKNTGLVRTALKVKGYFKSVFGASSAQFKQVRGLVFRGKRK